MSLLSAKANVDPLQTYLALLNLVLFWELFLSSGVLIQGNMRNSCCSASNMIAPPRVRIVSSGVFYIQLCLSVGRITESELEALHFISHPYHGILFVS